MPIQEENNQWKGQQEKQRKELGSFDQRMVEAGNKGDVRELRRIKNERAAYKKEHRIR